MSLFVDGRHTNRSETLKEADVQGGHMLECLKGQYGGGFLEQMDLGIAAGGLIRQTVVRDDHDPVIWDAEHSTIFNVQILNTVSLCSSMTTKTMARCYLSMPPRRMQLAFQATLSIVLSECHG